MARVVDLTNKTFGRLKVIARAPRPEYLQYTGALWLCECRCGTQCIVPGKSLRRNLTRSCGCIRSEMMTAMNKSRARKSIPST